MAAASAPASATGARFTAGGGGGAGGGLPPPSSFLHAASNSRQARGHAWMVLISTQAEKALAAAHALSCRHGPGPARPAPPVRIPDDLPRHTRRGRIPAGARQLLRTPRLPGAGRQIGRAAG